MGAMGFCSPWAVAAEQSYKEWIEMNEIDVNLSEQFGKDVPEVKIVHISDIHCSRTVSLAYIQRCFDRVNEIDADLIMLTGDYVTHDYYGRFRKKITGLLTRLKSKYGIYACLGNHDYGLGGFVKSPKQKNKIAAMKRQLSFAGIKLLRNESAEVKINSKKLNIAGIGDIWAEDFKPKRTFRKINRENPTITLMHNPEGVKCLKKFETELILSGHTHGSKFDWKINSNRISAQKRNYISGLYECDCGKMYVSRGLGRHGRTGFNTRPEITTINIK